MLEGSDDYDFNPTESSNLASLFGSSMDTRRQENQSLKYTAPKQPRPENVKEDPTKRNQQSSVIRAKVVTLYKLYKNEYNVMGKHGLAIIGSAAQNIYEIIVYKEKNNIVARVNIFSSFVFKNQNDNFSSFFDNSNQNWLVMFQTLQDRDDISKEIEKHGGKIDNPVMEQRKPEETETKPSNFESKAHSLVAESVPESDRKDLLNYDKTTTTNSSDTSTTNKSNILSRMAKMGQSVLPVNKTIQSDPSDSETTDSVEVIKPQRKPRKITTIVKEKESNSYMNTYYQDPPGSQNSIVSLSTHQVQNMATPFIVSQPGVTTDSFTNYYMENRLHNTEVKLNLSNISSKLDFLLNSISSSGAGSGIRNTNESSSQENVLKAKIKALELRAENLTFELESTRKKNLQLQESFKSDNKSMEIEAASKIDNETIIKEQDTLIARLRSELESAQSRIIENNLHEMELEKYKAETVKLNKEIEIQKLKLKDFEDFYNENKDKDLEKTVSDLNSKIDDLQLKLKDLEEYHRKNEEEKQKQNEEKDSKTKMFTENVKKTMSSLYENILENLKDKEGCLEAEPEIEKDLALIVRRTTYRIIKDFEAVSTPKTTTDD